MNITSRSSKSADILRCLLSDHSGEFQWGLPKKNGIEQLQLFKDYNIKCPEFTINLLEAYNWLDQGYFVYGRNLYHTQGKDIVTYNSRKFFRKDFWVKVIPIESEWRIHIFNGKCIARGLKVQTSPPTKSLPIRVRQNGWTLTHKIEPPKGIRTFAKQMVQAVDYLYGACDIVIDSEGTFWALEVNTRPGLDTYTAKSYMQAILKYMSLESE